MFQFSSYNVKKDWTGGYYHSIVSFISFQKLYKFNFDNNQVYTLPCGMHGFSTTNYTCETYLCVDLLHKLWLKIPKLLQTNHSDSKECRICNFRKKILQFEETNLTNWWMNPINFPENYIFLYMPMIITLKYAMRWKVKVKWALPPLRLIEGE